jgi:hypothetical protein
MSFATFRSCAVLAVLCGLGTTVVGQSQQPTVADLQAQIAALTAALRACQSGGGAALAGSARQDALAALHAVDSAISGGANTAEFKKYQLDAKIKVDALPATPENAPIRQVSGLYVDASRLLLAWQTETMSAADVHYFKTTYPEPPGKAPIRDLPDQGFDKSVPERTNESAQAYQVMVLEKERDRKLGAIAAQFGAKELLDEAAKQLAAIK